MCPQWFEACRLSWGGSGFEYSCLLSSKVGAWVDSSSAGVHDIYSLSMLIPLLLDIHLVYSNQQPWRGYVLSPQ